MRRDVVRADRLVGRPISLFLFLSPRASHTHTHTHSRHSTITLEHTQKTKKKFKNNPRSGPLSNTPRESCTVWRYPSRPVSTAIHQYTPISFPCRTPQDNFFLKKNYYFYALPSFFTAPTFAPLLLVYPSKSTSPFLQQLISICPFPSTPPLSLSVNSTATEIASRATPCAHTTNNMSTTLNSYSSPTRGHSSLVPRPAPAFSCRVCCDLSGLPCRRNDQLLFDNTFESNEPSCDRADTVAS